MATTKKKLAVVLGIRPDVIRASLLLQAIKSTEHFETVFIWSGQHYSDNLKDVFFRELNVPPPDIELGARGDTDAELVASVISLLYPALDAIQPEAVMFLGDTNTVMGCVAAAQLNLPIVHIEGCMRSYDWRMPEEKYRTTIDHVSDIIYAYLPEYREQGIREGINPDAIVVTQNLIVDVLHAHYFDRKSKYDALASESFFQSRGLERNRYLVMTCHRRENIDRMEPLESVMNLAGHAAQPVFFPAGYRTQRYIAEFNMALPKNVIMVDPVGYDEILTLLVNSQGVLTDSGTITEEAAVLGVPSIQMRRSTERPQVYDCGASVKFDPAAPEKYPVDAVYSKLAKIRGAGWQHGLGDGKASQRIAADLTERMLNDGFRMHEPSRYHLDISHSYRDDGLDA